MTPANYARHTSTRVTPQTQPIPGSNQVANSAGGFSFAVDDWTKLRRFLILGAEGGSYYAGEREMTLKSSEALNRCAAADFDRTLGMVVSISEEALAPKNDPAIFALAVLAADANVENRRKALDAVNRVCRTGTWFFQFLENLRAFRGRGPAVHRAMVNWYASKSPKDVAFQVTKYAQRNGWTHADVLRLCKPKTGNAELDGIFAYITGKPWQEKLPAGDARNLIEAVEAVKVATDQREVIRLIRNNGLQREVIPNQWFEHPDVWDAMLPTMGATALLRNLGKLSQVGLVKPLSQASKYVAGKFGDVEWLRKSRLHPFTILLGMTTYAAGRGIKGSLTWNAAPNVTDALDAAFYTAFGNIQPTGKNWLLGIDVSGSMASSYIAGTHLSARDAAAAMTMVAVRTEPNAYAFGFQREFVPLDITARDRLTDVVLKTSSLMFGATDCSVPMTHALKEKLDVDVFAVYTDSETYAGRIHPTQALRQYRERMQKPRAKAIVVGMVANEFSIADPADGGMLDVVGMDANAPVVMNDFVQT